MADIRNARMLLARTKAILSLNKRYCEKGERIAWTASDELLLNEIETFLEEVKA